ncbi:MAG: methyltransferase domain-containing protein [Vicingaceae bacterium]
MKNNNYNFIAAIYDQLTSLIFFGYLQSAQLEYLSLLPETGRILFIGGGTGSTLKKIVQLRPHLKIDYVDTSSKMISLSKKKLKNQNDNNVNFICGDQSFVPMIKYDGILSFFYFDLFPKRVAGEIFSHLLGQLKMNGIWLIADFYQAKNWHQKLMEFLMYNFLKLTTNIKANKIPPILPLASIPQLQLREEKSFYGQFIFSTAYSKSSWNNNC